MAPAGRKRTALKFQGGSLWHLHDPLVPERSAHEQLPLLYSIFSVLRVPSPQSGPLVCLFKNTWTSLDHFLPHCPDTVQ